MNAPQALEDRPLIFAAGVVGASILKSLVPRGAAWYDGPVHPSMIEACVDARRFLHPRGYNVLSCVEIISGETGSDCDRRPEYHVSISKWNPKKQRMDRCPGNEAKWILSCFEIEGWEEDNHVPGGIVRNFWRPVNENAVGIECPCKESETAILEEKGDYIWRGAP